MGTFDVFVMYSKSVHLFSTLRVKYFATVATCGVIIHLLENKYLERKSERSSLASTYNKISVSFKFCKFNNGDKLEITSLYELLCFLSLATQYFEKYTNLCPEESCKQ